MGEENAVEEGQIERPGRHQRFEHRDFLVARQRRARRQHRDRAESCEHFQDDVHAGRPQLAR
jgi:hypothetical protein